jgi:hypothetical protein
MDTPIATTDVTDSVAELIIVLRDVEEEFVVAKSDIEIIVGSNPIEFKLSYTAKFNFMW